MVSTDIMVTMTPVMMMFRAQRAHPQSPLPGIHMGKICDKEGVNFDMIADWTQSYNTGYTQLGMKNVCRPVLYRIPDGKKIGGHCVIPNAKLLKDMYPDFMAWDYVLRYQ